MEVCWLEIRGRVELKKLLLKTSYSAYLVFKLNKKHNYGLRKAMAEVGFGNKGDKICFAQGRDEGYSCSVFIDREKIPGEGGAGFPQPQGKEWMEIKLGELFNNLQGAGGDKDAEAALFGLQQNQWKSGLIVKGIHFRPNYY